MTNNGQAEVQEASGVVMFEHVKTAPGSYFFCKHKHLKNKKGEVSATTDLIGDRPTNGFWKKGPRMSQIHINRRLKIRGAMSI